MAHDPESPLRTLGAPDPGDDGARDAHAERLLTGDGH
jgi:hypothetical protein